MTDNFARIKLIRDSIPGMPDDKWIEIPKSEVPMYLKAKLNEEIKELKDSDYKDLDEFADVFEVLYSLARLQRFRPKDIEIARTIKVKERGGFSNKVLINKKKPERENMIERHCSNDEGPATITYEYSKEEQSALEDMQVLISDLKDENRQLREFIAEIQECRKNELNKHFH